MGWRAIGALVVALAGIAPARIAQAAPTPETAEPPRAEERPYLVRSPHGDRPDPYYWLRDDQRREPAVLAHLAAENRYYDQQTAPYRPLVQQIEQELVGRLKQDDQSVPAAKGAWLYYRRFETGQQYPVYARKPRHGGREQVLLDVNALARGKAFYQLSNQELSPDGRWLAYAADTTGRREHTIRIRDLRSGRDLPDTLVGVEASLAWGSGGRLFYIAKDRQTLLGNTLKRHTLGQPVSRDPVLYREKDPSFYMGVGNSQDDSHIVLGLSSTVSSEMRVLPVGDRQERFRLLAPRARDVQYEAEHQGRRWVIKTDWQAPNFRLMTVDDQQIGDRARWQPLLAHDPKVFLDSFAVFKHHLVLNERSDALERVRIMPWRNLSQARYIDGGEPVYVAHTDTNLEQDTPWLRYAYSSLTTPDSTYEIHMDTGETRLRKRRPVLGGFRQENYRTERVWVTARDGARVPVSLLYRKDFQRNGQAPLYQYAYGAYGASISPDFNSTLFSLVDRGFVYAIAHVRGGQEMGRAWYDAGRVQNKRNTFTDFIDVTDQLVRDGYAARDKVFASGESAGGLLMGAIANMAPDRYRGLIAHVPFVDAVTTMLDHSIPLTTNEFDEWGNPQEKAAYDYILSYSPYDQVKRQAYPAMLVTTGLNDSQVQYFEPAKWVAKLRTHKTDANPLLFRINMEAGHGGRSGRFAQLAELAEDYAFMLTRLEGAK
ncbi:MAG: S9 family peptidase [Candidatus Sericytochromatia bacterium]|nr:S9 family peptidase [Candidatus Sericytochromatia bacterium]